MTQTTNQNKLPLQEQVLQTISNHLTKDSIPHDTGTHTIAIPYPFPTDSQKIYSITIHYNLRASSIIFTSYYPKRIQRAHLELADPSLYQKITDTVIKILRDNMMLQNIKKNKNNQT
jgi:hypothetical protein